MIRQFRLHLQIAEDSKALKILGKRADITDVISALFKVAFAKASIECSSYLEIVTRIDSSPRNQSH